MTSHATQRPTGMAVRVAVLLLAAVGAAWLAYGSRSERLNAQGLRYMQATPPRTAEARALFVQAERFNLSNTDLQFIAALDWAAGRRAQALLEQREMVRREPENGAAWNTLAAWLEGTDPAAAARARARGRALDGRFSD